MSGTTSFTEVRCLILSCVVCGLDYEGDGYVPHFTSQQDAFDEAENANWRSWKGEAWCDDCNPACVCGHFFGEHDYGDTGCEDCSCAEYARAGRAATPSEVEA